MQGSIRPGRIFYFKKKASSRYPNMKSSHFFSYIALSAILLFAFILNFHTLYLPHAKGDEVFYVAQAMKIEQEGMGGYNLRKVDSFIHGKIYRLFAISKEKGDKGNLLRSMDKVEVYYYDNPLSTTPPLLSILIAASHKLFLSGEPYRILNAKLPFPKFGASASVLKVKWNIVKTQIYCTVWPLIFGILLVLMTFYLGRILYSDVIGLFAAFLVSISPIVMLCSSKVWADTMTAFFVAGAVTFYVIGVKNNRSAFAILAGVFTGLGALSKTSGLLPVLIVSFYHVWIHRSHLIKPKSMVRVFIDKKFLLFLLFSVMVAGPWYLYVAHIYGHPLYLNTSAQYPDIGTKLPDAFDWFKTMRGRSDFIYLVNIPYQTPLFVLVYFAPFVIGVLTNKEGNAKFLLISWVVIPLWVLMGTHETRYMLIAYPAVSILASYVLNKIRLLLNGKKVMIWKLGDVSCLILVALCAVWSINIGYTNASMGSGILRLPL
jgi:asparagine N-glycosylation enzyme membrane subunit Stt3